MDYIVEFATEDANDQDFAFIRLANRKTMWFDGLVDLTFFLLVGFLLSCAAHRISGMYGCVSSNPFFLLGPLKRIFVGRSFRYGDLCCAQIFRRFTLTKDALTGTFKSNFFMLTFSCFIVSSLLVISGGFCYEQLKENQRHLSQFRPMPISTD